MCVCVRARERVHSFLKECFMSKKEDEGVGVGGGVQGRGREEKKRETKMFYFANSLSY